ncbi:hypothetical protein WR25_14885 [Diploscapter pachys]|uniref:RIIa domain-containing protein n=1 Tax=Diploscapter pachys TaxID=2018661 RepID=A0A2A2LV61_9BILA|nr:hypothetical protein WR25_14885 [Diploscapter pachys]
MDGKVQGQGRYAVPEGLRPLLEAFARETIRTQPKDVARFGLLFFDELHNHRRSAANAGSESHTPHAQQLPSTSSAHNNNNIAHEDKEKHHNEEQSDSRCESPLDKAATKIQAVFKGHLVSRFPSFINQANSSILQFPRVSTTLFQVRSHPEKFGLPKSMSRTQSSEKMEAMNFKKDQKRHSVGGYQFESDSPTDRAATKIQAEIRGFLTRKHVDKLKKDNNHAATKIQAHIRGYLTRKHLDEQGLLSPTRTRSRGSVQSNQSDEQNLQ